MNYASIIRDDSMTFVIDGKTYKVLKTDPVFSRVKAAHLVQDSDAIVKLLDISAGLVNYASGSVTIADGVVTWNGMEMHNAVTKRMVRMMQEEFEISDLILFLDNMMENPSKTAINELYQFMDANELPITSDGYMLAYKKVLADYTDIYSGTFDNSVGQAPTMRRGEVDDDRDRTCSTGFHFCSKDYLHSFGSNGSGARVMIVKINPRDVVSIPSDYNNAKARCCDYEVVGEWDEWYTKFKQNEDDALLEDSAVNNNYSTAESDGVVASSSAPIKLRDAKGRFIPVVKARVRDAYGRFIKARK